MLDRIHQSKITEIMEKRKDGRPVEFSLQYCKRSTGELVTYERAVLTSFHSEGSIACRRKQPSQDPPLPDYPD